ncbi:MAG: thioredoxin family protein [Verrucomicrobiae bacterium]|nr:thioredoxin family protein [Verrucomicrobiae bacterium]MCX7914720.1 thioredoxin family protein [Verrucomicrobiae bacterium]MDW8344219.1 thioredoxin family protein [Verrucomicrobiae bacterium]
MNKWIISSLALCFAATAMALELGDAIPKADVKMKNVDGRELSIADVRGEKGTLVIFSCNHCPFVVAWEERIAKLGNEFQKRGVGVIQINSNDPAKVPADSYEAMQKRAKDRGFEFPYVVDADSSVARAFGATRTPEVFLFNAEGKLVYHGAIDDNHRDANAVKAHYLRDALEALVTGKEITTKTTKAVGCTIKWRS